MENDESNLPMIEKHGVEFPAALSGVIGDELLLEGEKPEDFWSLFQAVIDERKPQGFTDWYSAGEETIKRWENGRIRRFSVATVKGGVFEAANYFLNQSAPLLPHPEQPGHFMSPYFSEKLGLNYFSTNPKEQEKAMAQLVQHGITRAEIQAKATELRMGPLQIYERMIAARENSLRKLAKDAKGRQH